MQRHNWRRLGEDYWIFFYTSKKFLDTGDWDFSLSGNSPLFVNKRGGFALIPTSIGAQDWLIENSASPKESLIKLRKCFWGKYHLPQKHLREIEAVMPQINIAPEERLKRMKKLKAGW